MKTRIQQGFTLIELLVVITIIAILAGMALPAFTKIQERGYMTKGVSNAKQACLYLRIYSADNNGSFPGDAAGIDSSNSAFRLLFVSGLADNETVFGCPQSVLGGSVDGNIGTAGANDEACANGEVHWSLAQGITDSKGNSPLIWEVPDTGDATGTGPVWLPAKAGTTAKGRTWSGGKVIIGLTDGSANTLPVDTTTGTLKGTAGSGSGSGDTGDTNLFTSGGATGSVDPS